MSVIHRVINKLRHFLLPPESPQELFLRTLYHRVNATTWFANRQIKAARSSCRQWRENQPQPRTLAENNETLPTVAFLLFIDNGKGTEGLETLHSIRNLRSGKWQVFPVTPGGELPLEFKESPDHDRVHPPLSSEELKRNISSFNGIDFVVFCNAGDIFNESLLDHFFSAKSQNPTAEVFYFDCELQQDLQNQSLPFFKPAANSPELLLANNYLSRGFLRFNSIVKLISSTPAIDDPLVLEFSLMLEVLWKRAKTCHIPRLLLDQSSTDERMEAGIDGVIQKHLIHKGLSEVVIERGLHGRRVTWRQSDPSVSIIILNRDHGNWLRLLVNSIFTLTDYTNYSLIIVDNHSTDSDVKDFYSELKSNERVTVVCYDRDFNYSEAINTGVAHSQAEVVVLLNNDMKVTNPHWLRELVRWAVLPEIGVVGGKLLHRNRSIQHAGIILGMNGFIGHLYLNAPEHYHGLAGSVDWYRNYYALTGACQAMRRDLFHQVGGYDERFRLAFGDIDFCLRVFKAGYRNLYNPHAELVHYEGGSRGYETPVKDILLGYDELGSWVREDDPYFSPNLTYTPIPRCNFTPDAVNTRLANIENRKQSLNSGGDTNS